MIIKPRAKFLVIMGDVSAAPVLVPMLAELPFGGTPTRDDLNELVARHARTQKGKPMPRSLHVRSVNEYAPQLGRNRHSGMRVLCYEAYSTTVDMLTQRTVGPFDTFTDDAEEWKKKVEAAKKAAATPPSVRAAAQFYSGATAHFVQFPVSDADPQSPF